MALEYLSQDADSAAPSPQQLRDFLSSRGLMYTWGTEVEELAFAAREFGYPGSTSFHDRSLDSLAEILEKRQPMVVSLGTNGKDHPGHFVTVTGITPDGKWVHFCDLMQGEITLSAQEFQRIWELQGKAGLVLTKN